MEFLKQGVCISKKALNELARMASEGFENIDLSISSDGTTMVAEVPDYKIYLRLS
jgi:DNA polymerase III sliding clamp (beta) subunit (PCNA family)